MSAEIPPTDYFNGISFNKSFYQSSTDEYLTASTGKKLFLSYPISQGSEIFSSNLTLQSTLTDSSGSVGTIGQLLSSTSSGTTWVTQTTGSTYISYTASATLPSITLPTLLVIFSGTTALQTLSIPVLAYSIGQKIEFKNRATVNVTISTGGVIFFLLYGSSTPVTTYTLIPEDTFNIYWNGFAYIQYTPSNTFTKIVGSNGCLAGQTNYVSINTSALPQTVSTVINTDMFVFLFGSTASKVLSIPVVSNVGQRMTIKNTASVDVSLAFPSSNIMLFDSLTTTTGVILKTKETISLYWGSAFWIQTVPSNAMPELNTSTINPVANTTNLGICSSQTTGVLNLGVGNRTKTTGTAEGNINIGTGTNTIISGGTAPTINIGNNTATTNVTEISIGATNTKTTINGPLTLTGAIDVNGTLESNSLNALTTGGAQTIGGNITDGSITMGGAMTTGDINIGTLSTSDIHIGNSTNATTGTDKGICHISKCQFGPVANGSVFREIRFGTVAGGSQTATVSFKNLAGVNTAMISIPLVFTQIITASANTTSMFSLAINGVTASQFTYTKNAMTSGGALGAANTESFNWIAISI